MSDDNNDKLMAQFIERATPKLLEAMSEQIAAKVEEQLGGFKKHAEQLLDDVQDRKREREETQAQFDQFKKLLEQNPSDTKPVHDALNPKAIQLTRTQARDPALYRRAKAQAEQQGTRVEIIADAE